jgi:pimeloyl-ACP methyl ester carboxylesterase
VKKWIRRIGLGIVGLLVLAAVVGGIYELTSRRRAAREFPPPGKLVDIGGRRIHLDCRGSGAPTVVFEAGLDMGGSLSWAGVHDSISKTTRACAYSRAGIMWSDPRNGPQSAKTIADDLHATLSTAGEHPPYVLVGHSIGGPYITTYTKYYGPEVAGLVFVDASHPDQVERQKAFTSRDMASSPRIYKLAAALAPLGLVRIASGSPHGTPNESIAVVRAKSAYLPTSLSAMLKESDALEQSLAEAGTFRTLGDRPLFVLTGTAPLTKEDLAMMKLTPEKGRLYQDAWKDMQAEEASWSSRGQHELVTDASHYVQFDRPDVVARAIRSVVDSVRAKR